MYTLSITTEGPAITCHTCGTRSTDPHDVKSLHCKRCERYHARDKNIAYRYLIEATELLRPELLPQQRIALVRAMLNVVSPVEPELEKPRLATVTRIRTLQ